MMVVCPICGKRHVVTWPEFWPYQRGDAYFCCQNCMDIDYYRGLELLKQVHMKKKRGVKNMPGKITLAQKMRAVEIAKSGKSPLPYLRLCGARNPSTSWETIRNNYLKTHEGEDLPARFGQQKKKAESNMTVYATKEKPETVPTVKLTGPLRIETPEANKVEMVEKPDDVPAPQPLEYKTTAISTQIGEWQYFRKQEFLDWTPIDGCAPVSLTLEEWRELIRLFPEVIKVLGVEL